MKSLAILAILSLVGTAVALFESNEKLTIIIDPGHGGRDPGAFVEEITEGQLNLIWAGELKALAESEGHEVWLTRSADEFIDLKSRAEFVNNHTTENSLFISLHMGNATSSKEGAEIYISEDASAENRQLAHRLSESLNVLNNTDVKTADFFMLKQTRGARLMIQPGFMSHEDDLRDMMSPDYRRQFNQALLQSIRG